MHHFFSDGIGLCITKKMNSVIQHQVVDEMSLDTSEGFEFLRNTTEN